jgi:type VI protein secretion system component VasF
MRGAFAPHQRGQNQLANAGSRPTIFRMETKRRSRRHTRPDTIEIRDPKISRRTIWTIAAVAAVLVVLAVWGFLHLVHEMF